MLAKAVVFVQAVFADVNELAVAINNVESFITRLFALLTEFVFVRVAIGAVKTRRSFVATTNAQAVRANLERLEIVSVVGAY